MKIETKLAFQPGTFQIKLGYPDLKDLYEITEIFFCNKEEAEKILNVTEITLEYHEHMKKLLSDLNLLGPKIVVVTDGPKGCFVYDSYNSKNKFYLDLKELLELSKTLRSI
jgi:sugar/nucleoside kinase (ribokinase family)